MYAISLIFGVPRTKAHFGGQLSYQLGGDRSLSMPDSLDTFLRAFMECSQDAVVCRHYDDSAWKTIDAQIRLLIGRIMTVNIELKNHDLTDVMND